MGYLTFRLPNRAGISEPKDGLVALGITCLAYGSTELVHGYGFLAVFIAATAFRSVERRHKYHKNLHDFTEQIERLLMMVLLVCFGAAIAEGSIFRALSWGVIGTAALILVVVRPLYRLDGTRWICRSAVGKGRDRIFRHPRARVLLLHHFALGQAEFEQSHVLWVTVCFVVLCSILMHGVLVTPIMRRLDGSPTPPTPGPLQQACRAAGGS